MPATESLAIYSQSRFGLLIHGTAIAIDHEGRLPPLADHHANDLLISENADVQYLARAITPEQQPEGYTLTPLRQLITRLSQAEFERISRAIQLLEWQKNHHFCSRCGTATVPHSNDHAMVCPACSYTQYPRLQPVIIVAITRQDSDQPRLLLAQSVNNATGMFSLVAGFVEVGETLEQAVAREVKEEVGLDINNIRYFCSQPWPFPSNLMIGFQADYAGGEIVLQEAEIAAAGFYAYDEFPLIPPTGSIARRLIEHIVGTTIDQ